MFQECRYILTSGYKCKAPALRGQDFCYYHNKAHRYRRTRADALNPLPLPPVDDIAGIQISINQILRELSLNRLDRSKASTLLYGLQLAARLVKDSDRKLTESVRELAPIPPGNDCDEAIDLAPQESSCEPPHDCVHCDHRDFCPDFGVWEYQVQELEYRLQAARESNKLSAPDDDENNDEAEEE